MIRYITLFLTVLLISNTSKASTNLIAYTPTDSIVVDSAYVTQVNMLIRDYKACKEYSTELEERLITARELLSRTTNERDEYERLYDEVDNALKEMTERNAKMERKLKRTRKIGIGATICSFIVAVLVVLVI